MEVYDELEKALKKIERQEEKIMRLNIKNLELINIINEFEKYLEETKGIYEEYTCAIKKLKELKGVDKE